LTGAFLFSFFLKVDATSFDAFVLDYFPDTHRRFAGGMDMVQRTNLLLTLNDPQDIVARL
jgi:hypothetical protein